MSLEVRYADGGEDYRSFAGEIEHPEPHEMVFADGFGGRIHRNWKRRTG